MTGPAVWVTALIMTSAVSITHGSTRNIVDSCTCTVLNQTCEVEENKNIHNDYSSSYPTDPRNLTAQIMNSRTLSIKWLAPAGDGLRKTTGFNVKFGSSVGEYMYFYIPKDKVLPHSDPDKPKQNKTTWFEANREGYRMGFNPTDPYIVEGVSWDMKCVLDETFSGQITVTTSSLPYPPSNERWSPSVIVTVLSSKISPLDWTPNVSFKPQGNTSLEVAFQFPEIFRDKIELFKIEINPQFENTNGIEVKHPVGEVRVIFSIPEENRTTCLTVTIRKFFNRSMCAYMTQWPDRAGECQRARSIESNYSLAGPCHDLFRTLPPEHGTTARMIENSTVSHPPNNSPWRIYAPVAILFVLGLIVVVFAHKKFPGILRETCIGKKVCMDRSDVESNTHDNVSPNPRRVYLLYSDDHEAQMAVIHALATFLIDECDCEVRFDEWYTMEMRQDILRWHLNELKSTDQIIIIQSEGAYNKYRAYLSREALTDGYHVPKGDIFINVLSAVLRRGAQTNNCENPIVMVQFPHTPSQYLISDIKNSLTCKLPDRLEDFMRYIHDSQKSKIPLINNREYQETQSGRRLKEALQKASDFTKENPNWFDERYKKDMEAPHDCLEVTENRKQSQERSEGDGDNSSTSTGTPDIVFIPPKWDDKYFITDDTALESKVQVSSNCFHPPGDILGKTMPYSQLQNGVDQQENVSCDGGYASLRNDLSCGLQQSALTTPRVVTLKEDIGSDPRLFVPVVS